MGNTDQIDVEQIMRQIRHDLVHKQSRARNLPPPEESESPAEANVASDVLTLHDSWNTAPSDFSSQRRLFGPLVTFVQRVLRRLLDPVFTRQTTYNAANTRVTAHLRDELLAVRRLHAQTGLRHLPSYFRAADAIEEQIERLRREYAQLRAEILVTQRQAFDEAVQGLRREHALMREESLAAEDNRLEAYSATLRSEQSRMREDLQRTWTGALQEQIALQRQADQLQRQADQEARLLGERVTELGGQLASLREQHEQLVRDLLTPAHTLEVIRQHVDPLREDATQSAARYDLALQALREAQDALGGQLHVAAEHLHAVVQQLTDQLGVAQAATTALRAEHLTSERVLQEHVLKAERTVRRLAHALSPTPDGDGSPPSHRPQVEELSPAFDYLGLEERFRGSEEEIQQRQRPYLEYFVGRPPGIVLDLGCGRGEFLQLLAQAGVPARGIDVDLDMVLLCQEKGLIVKRQDALAHLESLPDGSLQGIFCAQVVEHWPSADTIQLVSLSYRKLAPGAALIVETPNPRCLTVFAESFYLDPSHVRLIHPEAARFLFESTGFRDVTLKFSAPVESSRRIPPLPVTGSPESASAEFNRALEGLNQLLYGFQDFAAIGRKAGSA